MDKLFMQVQIGNMTLKNRIVMPAMHLGYCKDGYVTDQMVNFYAERARGGAGLVIIGGCGIDEHGYGNMIRIDGEEYLDGLKRLTSAVKQEGARVAVQLYQPGRYSMAFMQGIQPVAPSPIPSKLTGQTPRELTRQEIEEIIDNFSRGARRAREAGFDAVEIIGSAGYLISQFLSPVTNQREDDYGGSRENRMRFGLEVVKSVRREVGAGYPVLMRVSGNEFMPGGNTGEEIADFCKHLENEGIDALNVTGGWHETRVPQITMGVPRGGFAYLAREIKEKVSIPVIACNRINDPVCAEEILQNGQGDLVGIARGLIADPYLPEKAKEGKLEDIRRCIGCNQGCLDAVFTMQPVSCLVNARAGNEGEKEIKPAGKKKRILVIGGGPAGMEAARVAAQRGHDVTLWEAGSRLGGQLNLAAVPPGREEFSTLVKYLENQLVREKVKVDRGVAATAQKVKDFGADAVLVATGGVPLQPQIPGCDGGPVVQAWEVLSGTVAAGKKVVIIGGGAVGCETAVFLASKGALSPEQLHFLMLNGAEAPEKLQKLLCSGSKEVTLLEMMDSPGKDIGVSTRWTILQDMRRYGVQVFTGTTALNVDGGSVEIANSSNEKSKIDADTVVLAAGVRAENNLYHELKGEIGELYLIGDAYKPQKAFDAIHQAFNWAAGI